MRDHVSVDTGLGRSGRRRPVTIVFGMALTGSMAVDGAPGYWVTKLTAYQHSHTLKTIQGGIIYGDDGDRKVAKVIVE
jgi:hypothetical protein